MIRPIRRLLTLAGRSGGRVSVIDYGEGLAIAAATHPIELVVNLDAAQVEELIDVLEEWRLLAPPVASVQG